MKAGRSCVLIAEMSSEGNLATGDYTKGKCKKINTKFKFHKLVHVLILFKFYNKDLAAF